MGGNSQVILCIDDDQDILDFFEMVLGSKGYNVVLAPTAEDGVRAFKEHAPALVFCDLMMEEVDAGTNFVKEIKALGSSVPIYMVTSVGDAMNMTTGFSDLGLRGVLQKPVDISNLMRIVTNALGE